MAFRRALEGLVALLIGTSLAVAPISAPRVSASCTGPVGSSPPQVMGVQPPAGPLGGGTSVVVSGCQFIGATAVDFGNVPAASFTQVDFFTIDAVTPAHSAATVDVTVTTSAGTSAISGADRFTFSPPGPCTSTTASTDQPPPGLPMLAFNVFGSAGSCPAPQFEFWVLPPGSATWQLGQAYSNKNSMFVDWAGQPAGLYYFSVWARDSSSGGTNGNSLGTWDSYTVLPYPLTSFPCRFDQAGANPTLSAPVGTIVTITGSAPSTSIPPEAPDNCVGPSFEFWMLAPGSRYWQLVQGYSFSPNFKWDTAGWAPGVYQFSVWARDGSSKGTHGSTYGRYDALAVIHYTLTTSPCHSAAASAAPTSPQPVTAIVTITASAAGCSKPLYQFWMLPPGSSSWRVAQPYSTSATFTWDDGSPPGAYQIAVWVKDASSAGTIEGSLGRLDALAVLGYTLSSAPTVQCAGTAAAVAPAGGTALSGTNVTMTFSSSSCANPRYDLWMSAPGSSTWQLLSPYHASPGFSWSTSGLAAGVYSFRLQARDAGGLGSSTDAVFGRFDANSSFTFTLTAQPCSSVTGSVTPAGAVGDGFSVTISAVSSGCPAPQYEFWALAPASSTWILVQSYSSGTSASWIAESASPGLYRVQVWVRDASSLGTLHNSLGGWDAYTTVTGTIT